MVFFFVIIYEINLCVYQGGLLSTTCRGFTTLESQESAGVIPPELLTTTKTALRPDRDIGSFYLRKCLFLCLCWSYRFFCCQLVLLQCPFRCIVIAFFFFLLVVFAHHFSSIVIMLHVIAAKLHMMLTDDLVLINIYFGNIAIHWILKVDNRRCISYRVKSQRHFFADIKRKN